VHAAAGDKAAEKMGEAGLIASDVIEQLGTVFAEWHR
jgi:NAD(P)H-hydrate repair Nnr-like enzyme with NAD(P)H-hydrate dehydratase domain